MPTAPNPSAGNRDAAIAWLVRRDGRALTASEAAAFEAWRSDAANARAYERASLVWGEMGTAVSPTVQPGPRRRRSNHIHRPPSPAGRSAIMASASALAACLALAWFGPGVWVSMTADARTGVGEIRRVPLPDGSSVTLDSRSAVSFAYGPRVRTVRLLRGEAVFHVAANPGRPFVVEAAGGSTRALGTIFVVSRQDGGAVVTGIEHRIAVTFPARGSVSAYAFGPGQSVAYGPGVAPAAPHPAVAGADAFERGELVFEDRPLAAVVAELNRYRPGRILLAGDVGAMTVSGVFRTDDPDGALAAVQARLGLKSISLRDALTILYK